MRLEIEDLACHRGGRRIFEDVSTALGAGEALVVSGRNGAGKSTLLAAIAGLVRPSAGSIRLDGGGERTIAECLHFVGHRDALKSSLSAAENLRFAASLLGGEGSPPHEALARVGLAGAGHLPAGYLSAGQRRRVALARLLVSSRPIWLLDEPLTALDTGSQAVLGAIAAEHLTRGGMIVAASHAPLPLSSTRDLLLGGSAA